MDGGEVAHRSFTDSLTGAYSRTLLDTRLAEELSRAARASVGFALFLFDVDYFKSVNDAYGHARGDEVLRQLVDRITGLLRGYDVLFRYGGDEFVLLLPDTAKADAVRIALRLAERVRSTEFAGDPPLTVTISLGVALFPDDATDAEGLFACADRRNYLAKSRGRACAVADDAESDTRPASSRLLERDTQLAAVREFLTRLMAERCGALRVTGEPGSGYTRFLDEAGRAAHLRGFRVVRVPDSDSRPEPSGPAAAGVVVIADRDANGTGPGATEITEAIRRANYGQPEQGPVGLIYAARSAAEEPTGLDLPVLDMIELPAWSKTAVRIWLRTTLQGEPSPALVEWLVGRSGGLPAQAERELDRLTMRDGLVRTSSGAWSVAPALLERSCRQGQRLPIPLTELIGRQHETAQVAQLLADRRLVTLVGPGGIGKTRLCLAVATAVADRFDDGAVFVPLAGASTPELVIAGLAQSLKVTEVPGEPLVETVREHLADQFVLLVLDNVEQVLVAAPLVTDLLASAPGAKVLATSRERLGLYAEHVYQVPPLPLPDPNGLRPGPEGVAIALAGSPALALFNTRARAALYDFTITPHNLAALTELCHRLDGLPLAIELAAARSDCLSPGEMLTQLRNQPDLPGAGHRDRPGRQQTLRGAIDWSYGLLDPADRELFVRMGVFAGGCRLDAVAAVCGDGSPTTDLEKRLTGLTDKCLLRAEPDGDTGVRYVMLETVRAYTVQRLAETGRTEAVGRRHTAHYAAFAQRAGQELTGPEPARWADLIERDYSNLRVAFDCAIEATVSGADRGTAPRIALGLWRFWRAGSHLGEGRECLDRLLTVSGALPDGLRAQVLHAAAVLAAAQDDHARAYGLAAESLLRARAADDTHTTAQASNALGIATLGAGDYAAARGFFTDSLAVFEQQDAVLGMAIAHGNLTKVALHGGDIDTASVHAARRLELDRRQGNTRGIMLGLVCLGEILLARGDTAGARQHLEEGLLLSRTLGDVAGEAMALHCLGAAAVRDGDADQAVRLIAAALSLRREVGNREDLAISLDTLAGLLAAAQAELAARLLGAAEALRSRYRLPRPGDDQGDRAATLAALSSALDESTLAAAWSSGQGASIDSVVDEAVERIAALTRM